MKAKKPARHDRTTKSTTRTTKPDPTATRAATKSSDLLASSKKLLERIRSSSALTVEVGKSMTAKEIAAAEKKLGFDLPEDYRAFLGEFGWLGIRDAKQDTTPLFVIGNASPKDERDGSEVHMGVVKAQKLVREETMEIFDDEEVRGDLEDAFRKVGGLPMLVAPLTFENGPCEGHVLLRNGKVMLLADGELDPSGSGSSTFSQWLKNQLKEVLSSAAQATEKKAVASAVLESIAKSVAGGKVEWRNDGLVIDRGDGVEVSVLVLPPHMGSAQRAFVEWYEPLETLAALDLRNRSLVSARGSRLGERVRFRGMVRVHDDDTSELAFVLASDAKIAIEDSAALVWPDREEMRRVLNELKWALRIKDLSRDGWTFHFTSGGVAMSIDLASERPCAETVLPGTQSDAEAIANAINRGAPLRDPAARQNPELERFGTAIKGENGTVVLRATILPSVWRSKDDLERLFEDVVACLPSRFDLPLPELVRKEKELQARLAEIEKQRSTRSLVVGKRDASNEGKVLSDVDFSFQDLEGANFRGVSYAETARGRFVGADLRGADFRDASVEGASFEGADLRGADFSRAKLHGANFLGALGAPQS